LLITRPITIWQIIIAKYLASLVLILFSLIPTLIYAYSISKLGFPEGNVDSGAIIGSYIGLFLLGATFTSIGLFSSALTKNQVVAFVICAALCAFAFLGFDYSSQLISLQNIEGFITNLGINQHYNSISRGVLDTRDLIYFITASCLFLFFTKLVIGGKR